MYNCSNNFDLVDSVHITAQSVTYHFHLKRSRIKWTQAKWFVNLTSWEPVTMMNAKGELLCLLIAFSIGKRRTILIYHLFLSSLKRVKSSQILFEDCWNNEWMNVWHNIIPFFMYLESRYDLFWCVKATLNPNLIIMYLDVDNGLLSCKIAVI